jgi:hypothetical protein
MGSREDRTCLGGVVVRGQVLAGRGRRWPPYGTVGHNRFMRAPKRRRPLRRSLTEPPVGVNLSELAKRASYVGSCEHKSYPSFA